MRESFGCVNFQVMDKKDKKIYLDKKNLHLCFSDSESVMNVGE